MGPIAGIRCFNAISQLGFIIIVHHRKRIRSIMSKRRFFPILPKRRQMQAISPNLYAEWMPILALMSFLVKIDGFQAFSNCADPCVGVE